MPLDLLKGRHERAALQSILTRHSRDIEELRRAGFVGTDPVTEDVVLDADLGDFFTGGNQIIVSTGLGSAGTLDIPQQSVILRRTGDIETDAAAAGDVLYMDTGGTLGFASTEDWTDDANITNNLHLKTVEFAASSTTYAMDEAITLYVPVFSTAADLVMQLPAPTFSGKWVFVADIFGGLDGTHRIKFTPNGGSDAINGAASFPSSGWFTTAYSSFLFLGAKGTGNQWCGVQL